MAEWFNGFVEANGLNVFYYRTGQGNNKPTILLLHGFSSNGFGWSRVARDLEETYDVVMTDARGHGRTQGLVSDFSSRLLGEDAAQVIRKLGLDKPFVFGHSMGAMTAAHLAADNPDLLRGAVLEDPPLSDRTPLKPEDVRKMKERNMAFQALPLEERIRQGQANNPHWSDEEIIPWAIAQGEYNPDIINHWGTIGRHPWREVMGRIINPVLLVTADVTKGAIVTPEKAQEVAQLCKSCQVAYIDGAGHCIHADRYHETMQVVLAFLGKH